ncbi:MAG: helix-turn-helix domain-containing protein [Lachnospiraceae bacterium]|nr:helix-turn-helix domain-containing protein [Lachnospiraceae bacterium]
MEGNKKYYELQALDLWDFSSLIRKARGIQGITLESLCKGICSFSMMGRMEKGERFLSKELRDRILARLGVCSDGYENFLFREDYAVWKRRQQIVSAIEESDYQTAEELLAYYDNEDDASEEEGKLGRQFKLVMKVQMMKKRGEDQAVIAKLCEEAVKLTVSDIDKMSVNELCLSVQELDMILEYEHYCHPNRLAWRCEDILRYINSDIFDTYSYVKIYPKVVCYLYQSMDNSNRDWNKLLRLCNVGIEQLRMAGRMYYFWELLEIRKEGMTWLLEDVGDSRGERTKHVLEEVIKTTEEWLDALGFVHDLCGTNRRMETSCYLYQQKEAYCISDVIKRRREMLGLTKKKLCEGICSEKTIGRLEAGRTKPQMEIVKQLFERLNLSGEYQRWQIVTKDVRVFAVVDEVIRCANNRDFDRTEKLLDELRQYISMDNPINRQFQERIEINMKVGTGDISRDDAVEQFRKVLEYTMPYEVAVKDCIKYLTNAEILCLFNIAIYSGSFDECPAYDALIKVCEHLEEDGISEHIAVWEAIMTNIANVYGDMGEYDKSDEISLRTMRESVCCYRMNLIAANLYNNVWNYEQRIINRIPVRQGFQGDKFLKRCMMLCQMSKNTVLEMIISKKIK